MNLTKPNFDKNVKSNEYKKLKLTKVNSDETIAVSNTPRKTDGGGSRGGGVSAVTTDHLQEVSKTQKLEFNNNTMDDGENRYSTNYGLGRINNNNDNSKTQFNYPCTNVFFVLFFRLVCFIFCFVLLLVLLQMKIYFQNEIDKIGRRRLFKPTYDGSMCYSSDIIISEKQSLTPRHGLSICLDMFVCLCNDFIEDDTGKAFLQYTDESPTKITPWFGYYFDLLYFIANHGDDYQLKRYQWLFNRISDSNETTDNASGNTRLEFIYDALKRCQEIHSLVHYTNNNSNTLMQTDHHQQQQQYQMQQEQTMPPQLQPSKITIFFGILKVLKCVGLLENVQRGSIATQSINGQNQSRINPSRAQSFMEMGESNSNDMSHLTLIHPIHVNNLNQSSVSSQNIGSIHNGITRNGATTCGVGRGGANIAIIDGASQLSVLDILFRLLHSNLHSNLKGLRSNCIGELIINNNFFCHRVESQQVLHTSRTSNEAIEGIELDIMEDENVAFTPTVPFVELILKFLETCEMTDKLEINIRKTRLPGLNISKMMNAMQSQGQD